MNEENLAIAFVYHPGPSLYVIYISLYVCAVDG